MTRNRPPWASALRRRCCWPCSTAIAVCGCHRAWRPAMPARGCAFIPAARWGASLAWPGSPGWRKAMRCRPCAAWRRAAIATRIDRRPAWSMWRWRGPGGGGGGPGAGGGVGGGGGGFVGGGGEGGAWRVPADAGASQAPAGAGAWLLTGPGIRGQATLPPCGLAHDFVPQWQANHAAFPCGVDLLLGGAAHIVGLPRPTRIVRTPHDTTEGV